MNALENDALPARSVPFGIAPLLLLATAFFIGMYKVSDSGPLWPDSPRYENGAAMMYDWMVGGFRGSPMQHATDNYAHYPAFSVPFHPPGYPAAMAGWFLVFGETHFAARLFLAVCWGMCGWLFVRLLRDFGTPPWQALLAGLLLITTPQMAIWSRDPMSEIPSFMPFFAAAICWNRWLAGRGRWYGLAALGLAETAFFFRVTTAGLVPGLLFYGLVSGQLPRRRWPAVIVFSLGYFGFNAAWVKFAAKYAAHEVSADGRGEFSLGHIFEYLYSCGPLIFLSGSVALGLYGLIRSLAMPERRKPMYFWLCWFGSYLLFKVVMKTSFEPRHFVSALPAFAGFAALLALPPFQQGWGQRLSLLFAIAIGANVLVMYESYRPGLVGYDSVAKVVAGSEKPGNVLLASWEDQDWIFRYRCAKPKQERFCLRSDRTLAIRVSHYAKKEAEILGDKQEDVLKVIRDGRVAYIVSCVPAFDRPDTRPEEMKLVHETMLAHPELVRPLGEFPVTVDYVNWRPAFGGKSCVWEVIASVEAGPPNLRIVVPTAGMEWKP